VHAIYNDAHNAYKNESKHAEIGPVRQNPIQRLLIKASGVDLSPQLAKHSRSLGTDVPHRDPRAEPW